MDSLIRWKRGDYSRLSHAVSRFNKIIREIEMDETGVIPSLKNYQDIKKNIYSRKELNRVINSLNQANLQNLSRTKSYDSGKVVTQWEYNEINKAMRRSMKNLQKEKETILSARPSIGMGDERLSEIRSIESSLEKLKSKKGKDFEKLKQRIFSLGRTDYKLKKAEIFRDNFYYALEYLSSYENYGTLKKHLDRIQNPIKFFEYVSKSPILMDIFVWYKNKEALHYGSFTSNEEAFDNSLMFHLGISDVKVF